MRASRQRVELGQENESEQCEMNTEMRHRMRRAARVWALSIAAIVALALAPANIWAQSDTPAAECGSGPNVACPGLDDPSTAYIGSVTAVPDGVIILLTDDGLEKARACGGAAEIARMAETLYATIPDTQKADFQLDWKSQQLVDEIYGHAFLDQLSSGLGGLGDMHERSNPINIVFADYGGPGQMTMEARTEQAVYAALGSIHRAAC